MTHTPSAVSADAPPFHSYHAVAAFLVRPQLLTRFSAPPKCRQG
jgi:hypothetical protein